MAPLNVVLLIDEMSEWTGTEVHLLRLLPRLDPRRVRPLLSIVGRSGLTHELRQHGVEVVPLHIHRTLALSGLTGIGRLASLLRRRRADLLVTYHTASDILGPLAGRLAGVPVLSCRRDEGFTKKAIHIRVQRPLNRMLLGMIAVSWSVVRAVHRTEGFPPERAQVIWNGEDLNRFSPRGPSLRAELGISPDACVITAVSLLAPVKDVSSQLRAYDLLRRDHPDAVLVVAGDGPLKRELQREASGLGGDIRFLGHVQVVPALLRASDIFLQSSISEGFSNAVLQAMACGLPVVVTDVGGNPELVPKECGFLARPGAPEDLAARLAILASNPVLRRRMGAAARARTERYGSLDLMVERYSDAFERAVRGGFPGPSSG